MLYYDLGISSKLNISTDVSDIYLFVIILRRKIHTKFR